MIYLATPYTHKDQSVVQKRVDDTCEAFSILSALGKIVLSPILLSHPVSVRYNIGSTWEVWKKVDLEYIKTCDELYVITLDGWKESVGVQAEIIAAKELGVKVSYYSLEDLRKLHFDKYGRALEERTSC